MSPTLQIILCIGSKKKTKAILAYHAQFFAKSKQSFLLSYNQQMRDAHKTCLQAR